jgi:hypothetical protein
MESVAMSTKPIDEKTEQAGRDTMQMKLDQIGEIAREGKLNEAAKLFEVLDARRESRPKGKEREQLRSDVKTGMVLLMRKGGMENIIEASHAVFNFRFELTDKEANQFREEVMDAIPQIADESGPDGPYVAAAFRLTDEYLLYLRGKYQQHLRT